MRDATLIRNAVVTSAFLVLAACSSASTATGAAPAPGGGGGGGVAIQITNDVVPPTTITVWIVPETGSRRRLGTVSPNGRQTFRFNPGIASMDHRLLAQVSGGQNRTSNPFVLNGVTAVQWNVSSDLVRTSR